MKIHYNFACIKFGNKYTAESVNRLYNNISKHTNLPFTLHCITDQPEGINSQVRIIDLDLSLDLEYVSWKLVLFNIFKEKKIPIIYFDLDIVIQKNPIHLFNRIIPNKIIGCSKHHAGIEFGEKNNYRHSSYINTSMIGFNSHQVSYIYDYFMKDKDFYLLKYQNNDDRFISNELKDSYSFFNFSEDYYFRGVYRGAPQPGYELVVRDSSGSYPVIYNPDKTVCIITNSRPCFYEGLEEYFI